MNHFSYQNGGRDNAVMAGAITGVDLHHAILRSRCHDDRETTNGFV